MRAVDESSSAQRDDGGVPVSPAWPWLAPAAALQFLTICPLFVRRAFSKSELGASVSFFPIVGLLLGGALSAAGWIGATVLPWGVVSAGIVALWLALTGGLHFDGLLDSCDGLFGGRNAQQRLEIMRDERVGAFAVAGGVLLLLGKWSAIFHLGPDTVALLAAPVAGRWVMVLAIWRYPYVRDEGLGLAMKEAVSLATVVVATLVALGVVIGLAPLAGAVSLVGVLGVCWLVVRFVIARIGGMTGDTYGLLCEAGELAVLVSFCAFIVPEAL